MGATVLFVQLLEDGGEDEHLAFNITEVAPAAGASGAGHLG
jgi:hypothetical protein